jgi:hypothetical protein
LFPLETFGFSHCLFMGEPFQMRLSRNFPSLSFSLPTGATTPSRCPHSPFGHFIPPFLLACTPNFPFTAVFACKGDINVVASFYKVWDTHVIAIDESTTVYPLPTTSHYSGYLILFGKSLQFKPMCRSSQIFLGSSFGFDFLTALFSTFHALVEFACLPLPCLSFNRRTNYSRMPTSA